MPAPIRVLLVEGCQLVLWALERLFESDGTGIVIVGKTGNPADALRTTLRIQPDVVLLGLDLGSAALSVIPKLVKQPRIRVVVRAATADPDTVIAPFCGCGPHKEINRRRHQTIRKVHAGELWLDQTGSRIFGLLTRRCAIDPDTAKIAS
jgi:DNA-binding NarL/FixJ family response regulator